MRWRRCRYCGSACIESRSDLCLCVFRTIRNLHLAVPVTKTSWTVGLLQVLALLINALVAVFGFDVPNGGIFSFELLLLDTFFVSRAFVIALKYGYYPRRDFAIACHGEFKEADALLLRHMLLTGWLAPSLANVEMELIDSAARADVDLAKCSFDIVRCDDVVLCPSLALAFCHPARLCGHSAIQSPCLALSPCPSVTLPCTVTRIIACSHVGVASRSDATAAELAHLFSVDVEEVRSLMFPCTCKTPAQGQCDGRRSCPCVNNTSPLRVNGSAIAAAIAERPSKAAALVKRLPSVSIIMCMIVALAVRTAAPVVQLACPRTSCRVSSPLRTPAVVVSTALILLGCLCDLMQPLRAHIHLTQQIDGVQLFIRIGSYVCRFALYWCVPSVLSSSARASMPTILVVGGWLISAGIW